MNYLLKEFLVALFVSSFFMGCLGLYGYDSFLVDKWYIAVPVLAIVTVILHRILPYTVETEE